jgi:hypothetical protein
MAEEDRQRRWRRRRFANLRSVRWRIDLGILPASPGASVDELRRAAADSRRRWGWFAHLLFGAVLVGRNLFSCLCVRLLFSSSHDYDEREREKKKLSFAKETSQ